MPVSLRSKRVNAGRSKNRGLPVPVTCFFDEDSRPSASQDYFVEVNGAFYENATAPISSPYNCTVLVYRGRGSTRC